MTQPEERQTQTTPSIQAALPLHDIVSQTLAYIETGDSDSLQKALSEMNGSDLAYLLEAMPPEQRTALWEAIPSEQESEVLTELQDEVRASIVEEMETEELMAAVEHMQADDLADFIDDLPLDVSESVLEALDSDQRTRLESALSYEEDTAGRLMDTNVLSVRADVTLGVVLRWLRRHSKLPTYTDALMVTDDEGNYLGKLSMEAIVTGDADSLVEQVMQTNAEVLRASASEHDVAMLFDRRHLISVPVLADDQDTLLGRLTIDHAVYIIREEADHALLKTAGLDEDSDLFAPVIPSAKRRGFWLGLNLLTVFIAAWVIGQFQAALDQIVALAVLMPIVASMGGIAGSQTLTLTIRGMALDQIASGNTRWLTLKELSVGALNGVVWSVVVAAVTWLWFRDVGIALVIAAAMILNLLAASFCGVTIPIFLKKVGIDPALSSAVLLTTVTDVIGFLSFLGLATWFLL